MYKAIEEIGGYKIGEEVPTEKALTWLKMYIKPPVEKIGSEGEKAVAGNAMVAKPEGSEKDSSKDVMLDDYLSRNTGVVKKNIQEDDLSQEQLESLLDLEKSDKNREAVVKAIKKRLKD